MANYSNVSRKSCVYYFPPIKHFLDQRQKYSITIIFREREKIVSVTTPYFLPILNSYSVLVDKKKTSCSIDQLRQIRNLWENCIVITLDKVHNDGAWRHNGGWKRTAVIGRWGLNSSNTVSQSRHGPFNGISCNVREKQIKSFLR